MIIEIIKQDDSVTQILVRDEMTVFTVLEQKNILLPELKEGHALELDLSEVTEMDGAGMQLLIFMKQEATRIHIQFKLLNHSQPVVDVIELLNLTDYFGDPVIIPADWSTS